MIKSPEIESTLSKPGDFMKPKTSATGQEDLFRSRLDQILNRRHPLFRLANTIDWSVFDKEFGSHYVAKIGRPGLPIRLLVGLHYLKHAYNVSDETVVAQFIENGYWQYFCGFEHFQHQFPLDPTTLVKWRKRIGPRGMEKLLQVTIETARGKEYVTEKDLERVNVDTTVQEKAISFPTDARLYTRPGVFWCGSLKEGASSFARVTSGWASGPSSCRVATAMPGRRSGPSGNKSGYACTLAG